jgi:large subunit ribosomal protein L32e
MSIKTLTDLPGLKEENIAELESIGITSVSELKDAVNDAAKAKEVIKALSGVGPKTVEGWKAALGSEEPKAETQKAEAPKKETAKTKTVIEEPEEEAEVEIVSEGGYVVKLKPELSEETTDALAKRAVISGRRPAFKRQEWFRYSKLGEKWRKPKGIHSKMKRRLKRRQPLVDIGFRGPVAARALHPSGFEEILVHNVDGLENIDPKVQAVRIGGTVGTKKRIAIEDRADELGIRVLNRMV